jgi:ubiquinone/menaquinone biosynthesis C-methylase UbiE
MLSIEEIRLIRDKMQELSNGDINKALNRVKKTLDELLHAVDETNKSQIENIGKTKAWYQRDLDWRRSRKEILYDKTLVEDIQLKINNFAKMGNDLQNCLEIGPGYGDFTRMLLPWRNIFLLDVLETCFSKIKKEFNPKHHQFLKFYTTDRTKCDDIPTQSCNFIFSWDTFVFFTQKHIADYLRDMKRVLIPGGYGLVHYCDCHTDKDLREAKRGYWQYNNKTAMEQMVKDIGYEVIETSQFRPGANYIIFKKPGNQNPVIYQTFEIPVEK